ncbi:MAG: YraN family protein [Candidatus Babeliales bacterium]|jgi:putative endonuclease
MQETALLGAHGESLVADWLEKQGFTILARNYRTRCGEVDIIAERDEVVAFIEVKTRQYEYFPISQAVTWPKQQRIIKAAKFFIVAYQIREKVLRFDVATVIFEQNHYQIDHIPNAFQAQF